MLTNEEELNSEYLTKLFCENGMMDQTNAVSSISKEIKNSEGSLTYFFQITYSHKNEELPKSIYIKFDKIRATKHYKKLTRNEIDFYHLIQPQCKNFTVDMLDANYNDTFSYLLLQNFSQTHFVPPYETEIEYYKLAVKRIAVFHHHCYQIKLSRNKNPDYSPMNFTSLDLSLLKKDYQSFRILLKDELKKETIDVLELALHSLELYKINEQLKSRQLTIVHGDFHLENCLFNKEDPKQDMRILDWQWWNYGIGTYDVAHLLNLYLPTKLKNQEIDILKEYFNQLMDLGYQYMWDECLEDYKLFTTLNLFKPAHYAISCRLRRKKKFWVQFTDNIVVSYKKIILL